jgi:hypothetical protein
VSLSTNFPTIRPSLLLDFAKSRTVDPRITFTRASTATYFDEDGVLQSAAVDRPRIDFNPSTLVCNGLLIEEQRTNIFPNSNDFSNATYWTVYGTAVATAGAATGPDGLTSASNLAGATTTTLGGDNIEESISISASTAYTFSVFVKSNGGTTVELRLRDSTGGSTSTATLTVTSAWQRISLTRTMAAGATSVRCIIGATNGDIFIYGAQLEAGAFATSYIPTTTTALTRNADVASMTGTNFSSWYSASEGTLYAEYGNIAQTGSGAGRRIFTVSDGTTSNQISLRWADGAGLTNASVLVSGSQVVDITGSVSATSKAAFAYKLNDYAISRNGGAVTTDTSATVPSVNTAYFGIGADGSSTGAQILNGHIRRLTYYPARLVNAQLQALTL